MASKDLVDVEYLSQFFHLPITEASKELGICATALKKICRKHGIPRWPARKIRSIDKIIAALQDSLEQSPTDENVSNELNRLKKRRMELIQNPSLAAAPDERRLNKGGGTRRKRTKDGENDTTESPDATAASTSTPVLVPVSLSAAASFQGHVPQSGVETGQASRGALPYQTVPITHPYHIPQYPYPLYPVYPPNPYAQMIPGPMYGHTLPMYPPPHDMQPADLTAMHTFYEQHSQAMASLASNPASLLNPEAFSQAFPRHHQQTPNTTDLYSRYFPPQALPPGAYSNTFGSNGGPPNQHHTNNGTTIIESSNSNNSESNNHSGNTTTNVSDLLA